ncbi:MAG: hypothetical protein R3E08_09360 [Thiotrichaceae bacterium]
MNAEKEAQEQALAAGCRACLVKPIWKKDVLNMVQQLIGATS